VTAGAAAGASAPAVQPAGNVGKPASSAKSGGFGSGKADAGQAEVRKADAGQTDAGQAEVRKADAGQTDAGQAEVSKADSVKADSVKAGQASGTAKPGPDAGQRTGAAAAADGEISVRVVPGIARYHKSDCILIRFLADDDLEVMSRESAAAGGYAACKACQPDQTAASVPAG